VDEREGGRDRLGGVICGDVIKKKEATPIRAKNVSERKTFSSQKPSQRKRWKRSLSGRGWILEGNVKGRVRESRKKGMDAWNGVGGEVFFPCTCVCVDRARRKEEWG
jgi:hypothetical protein